MRLHAELKLGSCLGPLPCGSAPGKRSVTDTKARSIRLPTPCALWKEICEKHKTPPIAPFLSSLVVELSIKKAFADRGVLDILSFVCEPRLKSC